VIKNQKVHQNIYKNAKKYVECLLNQKQLELDVKNKKIKKRNISPNQKKKGKLEGKGNFKLCDKVRETFFFF